MKVDLPKTSAIASTLVDLQKKVLVSWLAGDYKNYKATQQKYFLSVTQNFDIAKNIKPPKITVPLFSKQGFNTLKIKFLDLFRVRTPEEKLMKKMYEEEAIKQQLDKFF